MIVIIVIIAVFIVFEFTNVLALYFQPEFRFANTVGVFEAWKRSKEDSHMHDFVRYLVNWVAGAKIIFIFLLTAILIWGSELMQIIALGALIPSTLTFYWKLYPLIRKMDKNGQIKPKNYSIVLAIMILSFILAFSAAFVYGLIVFLQT